MKSWIVAGVVVALLAGVGGAALLARNDRQAPAATLSVAEALGGRDTTGYTRAVAPRDFSFPADHGPHPGYRTEWWYFTGNLATRDGRHLGYQLTFFRVAMAPQATPRASPWATTDVYMGHFAVTDTAGGRFHPHARFARGAAGLAGARSAPLRVWLEDWSVEGEGQAALPMRLRAEEADVAIDLVLDGGGPVVLQGDQGLSRKGPEPGNASYYYSLTRMPTRGAVRVGSDRLEVTGQSWMDREWSTSALGDKTGWDWFALQLGDGRDVMFYRLRRADGSTDGFSAGSVTAPDGRVRRLGASDARLEVLATWPSPVDGTRYPSRWRLTVPGEGLVLEIAPRLADQEFHEPVRYWEGAVAVRGVTGRGALDGVGYVEMVGYAPSSRTPRGSS